MGYWENVDKQLEETRKQQPSVAASKLKSLKEMVLAAISRAVR